MLQQPSLRDAARSRPRISLRISAQTMAPSAKRQRAALPDRPPDDLLDSRRGVSSPDGAGRPGFRVDRRPSRCSPAPAGRAGRAPAEPAARRPAAWRIPTRTRARAAPGARCSGGIGGAFGIGGATRSATGAGRAAGRCSACASSSSRRPRPTEASRCSSDMRCFCGRGLLDRLGLARADLVLRRDRQLLDARHARRTHRRTLRLRRNERPLAVRASCGAASATVSTGSRNSDGFGAIGRIVTSSIAATGAQPQARLGAGCGADARRVGDRRRRAPARPRDAPGRSRLGALRQALRVGAQRLRQLGETRGRRDRLRGGRRSDSDRRERLARVDRLALPTARRRCRSRRPTRARCLRGFRRRSRRR